MTEDMLIRRIVIAGGGSAGWMAATGLSAALGPRTRIELVESDDIGTVGVGEATIPPIRQFNSHFGVPEAEFLKATHGTIKLGIEFVGWGDADSRYPHPFGSYGTEFDRVPIWQHWLAAHRAGANEPLSDFSFAWALARAGRFQPMIADPRRIQSTHDYAYHFDAARYARLLRNICEQRDVVRTEGRISDVVRNRDTGLVEALTLSDGRSVAGDFFIDCTGFRALLIGDTMETPFEDWSHWLPCDRAIAMPTTLDGRPDAFTRATAHAAGWQWRIPLQHRIGNGIVYSSAHLNDDEAEAMLRDGVDGEAMADPRPLRFTTGRRAKFWNGNVVAAGLSAGFMEPLESTSLHLVQTAIMRLIALLPERGHDQLAEDEFNRITGEEYARIRNFLILHYHANRRPEPFWRDRATMQIPDELAWKLANFRRFGRVVSKGGQELFANTAWISVMVGQGILPENTEPLERMRANPSASDNLAILRRVIDEGAKAAPLHRDWLKQARAYSDG